MRVVDGIWTLIVATTVAMRPGCRDQLMKSVRFDKLVTIRFDPSSSPWRRTGERCWGMI